MYLICWSFFDFLKARGAAFRVAESPEELFDYSHDVFDPYVILVFFFEFSSPEYISSSSYLRSDDLRGFFGRKPLDAKLGMQMLEGSISAVSMSLSMSTLTLAVFLRNKICGLWHRSKLTDFFSIFDDLSFQILTPLVNISEN